MLRRLFRPRSERHAYQIMVVVLVVTLLGILAIKMVLWWAWGIFISG